MRTALREAAAFLACAAALGAAGAELGSLFTTPQERARLDRLRRGEPSVPAAVVANPKVTGFVRRSDGRSTVWINGVPVLVAGPGNEALLNPAEVRAPGEGEVRIEPAKKPQVKR